MLMSAGIHSVERNDQSSFVDKPYFLVLNGKNVCIKQTFLNHGGSQIFCCRFIIIIIIITLIYKFA